MLEFYPNLNITQAAAAMLQRPPSVTTDSMSDNSLQASHQCNGRPENLTTNINNNNNNSTTNNTTATIGVKCEVQQQQQHNNHLHRHHQKTYEICEGCGQKIHDRYLMRVADASWHEHCLACCVCGVLLAHSCYTRNTKLYCKMDYDRIFGVKCSRCGDRLLPHEMVMRAQQHVFHLPCFVCVVCCQPLQKGEQFVLRAGQLFCRQDFEKEMYLMQQAGTPEDDLLDDGIRSRDGRRGPKRPRTILTSAQRRQFKASFEVSPKPCRKVREALAKETGLSVRVVQVWFQNQRAKMKKIQRKAKQESDTKSSSDKEKDGNVDSTFIKQESPSSDHNFQPLNPYSPDDNYPAHSGDSFCSSDISLDDSTNFDHLDDGTSDTLSLQNLDLQTSHSSTGHDSISSGTIANPIDKLYLMQNSYFNSEQ